MPYPAELCQLVIKNMEILEEAPNVINHIEEKLFAAINGRVKECLSSHGGWKGCFELFTGERDQTVFALQDWPEDEDGGFLAYFSVSYVEAGEERAWLSNAVGLGNAALCLEFTMERDLTGLNVKEQRKRLQDFYGKTPKLAEAGFRLGKSGTLYRPFSLDAVKVADDYPDFDESLSPLDAVCEDLTTVVVEFDLLVRSCGAQI